MDGLRHPFRCGPSGPHLWPHQGPRRARARGPCSRLPRRAPCRWPYPHRCSAPGPAGLQSFHCVLAPQGLPSSIGPVRASACNVTGVAAHRRIIIRPPLPTAFQTRAASPTSPSLSQYRRHSCGNRRTASRRGEHRASRHITGVFRCRLKHNGTHPGLTHVMSCSGAHGGCEGYAAAGDLALDPVTGKAPLGKRDALRPGLCGALMSELVLRRRVAVTDDRAVVVTSRPSADSTTYERVRHRVRERRRPPGLVPAARTPRRRPGRAPASRRSGPGGDGP